MRPLVIVLRAAGVVAVVAAVVGQLVVSIGYWNETGVRDLAVSITNFFSFFTIQSNLIGAVALGIGAVRLARSTDADPRWFAVLRGCATTYLVTTGVVYNLLLRGIELPQGSTLPWSNEVLHVVVPIVLLVDWLFAPGRRRLGWSTIGIIVIYPLVWAGYTMLRGPFVFNDVKGRDGWYPYPFLDPGNFDNGYGTVILYVLGIAALIATAGCGVVAISRVRGAAVPVAID